MTNFWQAASRHKIIHRKEAECRLYYDDAGCPIVYSQEELDGKYIVIDKQSFLEARMDVIVKDEKLVRLNLITEFRKLVPADEGTETLAEDITLIGQGQHWKTKYYAD